jgi:predicted transcriptional regulator
MNNKPNSNSFVKVYLNITNEILKKTDAACLAVYITILRHRNTGNNMCFPSIKTIADIVNVSDSTVKRAINKLYENGFLDINSGTKGTANNYYFPKENFYEEWNSDLDQLRAYRKKKAFKKAKKSEVKPLENVDCYEKAASNESDPF